ncbi:hypothetical protein AAY473_036098 [Plecturocebus cupreus]
MVNELPIRISDVKVRDLSEKSISEEVKIKQPYIRLLIRINYPTKAPVVGDSHTHPALQDLTAKGQLQSTWQTPLRAGTGRPLLASLGSGGQSPGRVAKPDSQESKDSLDPLGRHVPTGPCFLPLCHTGATQVRGPQESPVFEHLVGAERCQARRAAAARRERRLQCTVAPTWNSSPLGSQGGRIT